MPQMAPMMWSILFTVFSLTLIVFTALNYYTSSMIPKQEFSKIDKKIINWKW
uniref:ATP synthase F0 subunit 8 n=1 Tax=Chalcophora japonica TaxID=2818490 RepID=UPI0020010291|nr:ATP synthase F0 subunit 8 [Chalcophora japonica]UNQ87647.1 ATP synthase F0 subunit 8 [Chalcophora japonica]